MLTLKNLDKKIDKEITILHRQFGTIEIALNFTKKILEIGQEHDANNKNKLHILIKDEDGKTYMDRTYIRKYQK